VKITRGDVREAVGTSPFSGWNWHPVKITRGNVREAVGTSPFLWLVPLPSFGHPPQIRHFKLGRDVECTSRIWRGNSYSVKITRGDVRVAVGQSCHRVKSVFKSMRSIYTLD
jgi:hypothetical protein